MHLWWHEPALSSSIPITCWSIGTASCTAAFWRYALTEVDEKVKSGKHWNAAMLECKL